MAGALPTLTATREIDPLFSKGARSGSAELLVLAIESSETRAPEGRVLFVAGKRLGGAVTRNRCKRVLREAARRQDAPWPGWDVALVARPLTASAKPVELDRALQAALQRLGVRA